MIGTKDHAEIVRGLIRQIYNDDQRVDVSIEEVDDQIQVTFHLDDIPYVGVKILPMQVYVNGERIVGRPELYKVGTVLGSTRFIQAAKITDLDLPGEADGMGCAQNTIWLESEE